MTVPHQQAWRRARGLAHTSTWPRPVSPAYLAGLQVDGDHYLRTCCFAITPERTRSGFAAGKSNGGRSRWTWSTGYISTQFLHGDPTGRTCYGEVQPPSSRAASLMPWILVTHYLGLNLFYLACSTKLTRMGAHIDVQPDPLQEPEPVGCVVARTSSLIATDIQAAEVPGLIDELPLFLLAAASARGTSRLRGAAELRAKESDRLKAMAELLKALDVDVVEYPDGMDVIGRPEGPRGGTVRAYADHRLAMVAAVAGAASQEGVTVDDVRCIAVSFPDFIDAFAALGGRSRTTGCAPGVLRVRHEARQ